ncbi:nitroreductase family protein [Clostridium intestinale]|uniref:Nitroreductase n=1 Tax=Clostridium intestinale TaxID=36845 RepID=A0A7D6ZW26_9CLOT|nr:nitroreductase family protein [Clostridium intestinale]QLY78834.1 nitroreductase [Clostridium intestinale]
MKMDFPIEKTIKERNSVRTYEKRPLSKEDKEKLMEYANTLSNPFGAKVAFRLLENKSEANSEKLGTYGVIKGTKIFIGATVPNEEFALEALGYDFEKLVLYATHLGLGTCWLAGTFNRNGFTAAMHVKENELFPAVSAIGYPAVKKSLTESFFRKTLKSNQRKDWNELFFKDNFNTPLKREEAGEYTLPLEMLRLAPSATNKQPWRVVQSGQVYHFYEEKALGYSDAGPVDIQKVDVGISVSHFHLTALENSLKGDFEKLQKPSIVTPDNTQYLFSWIPTQE